VEPPAPIPSGLEIAAPGIAPLLWPHAKKLVIVWDLRNCLTKKRDLESARSTWNEEVAYPPVAVATQAMNLRQLTATIVTAAAAATTFGIAPAQAQFYGYGNDWHAPIQSGRLIRTTQSGMIYRPQRPVMQQPDFGQPRLMNRIGNFGHSTGSYFGW